MDNNRIMEVTDENGNVRQMYILFTTKLDEDGLDYVFYTDNSSNDGQVFVSSYTEDGHLSPVEDDNVWERLEQAFNQFVEETRNAQQSNEGCAGCASKGDCDCDGNCEGKDECEGGCSSN